MAYICSIHSTLLVQIVDEIRPTFLCISISMPTLTMSILSRKEKATINQNYVW